MSPAKTAVTRVCTGLSVLPLHLRVMVRCQRRSATQPTNKVCLSIAQKQAGKFTQLWMSVQTIFPVAEGTKHCLRLHWSQAPHREAKTAVTFPESLLRLLVDTHYLTELVNIINSEVYGDANRYLTDLWGQKRLNFQHLPNLYLGYNSASE